MAILTILTMDFQINLKKKIKNKKKFIVMFIHLWTDSILNFMQFHYHLIVHQRSSKFHTTCNCSNLTIFDGLSNDNEVA
jgi:UDP-N-acetylglucosamine transferase subunit ALG13